MERVAFAEVGVGRCEEDAAEREEGDEAVEDVGTRKVYEEDFADGHGEEDKPRVAQCLASELESADEHRQRVCPPHDVDRPRFCTYSEEGTEEGCSFIGEV